MTTPIELHVYGTPAPQGSKKALPHPTTGRPLLVESSAKVRPWRMDVKAVAEAHMRNVPGFRTLDCALRVTMVFTVRKPSSEPKTRRSWPMRKPDVSKLVRSTEDALTDAGFWADDARVVEYARVAKVYPGEDRDALPRPGVLIRVELLSEQPPAPDAQRTIPITTAEVAGDEIDRIFG